ncbi:transposase [Microcoleus sp. FACHB-68]|uniref:transposase n=1 Tax=Microcoleus sp. FACHB-68 TaxID=2692826 RepID=UPI0018F00888|nr:transposase [Microcoleus sp. FACHB-68]
MALRSLCSLVMDTYRWIIEALLRPQTGQGFEVLPKRWLVERTFAWFNWCRRLSKDYEMVPQTCEAFLYVGMIPILLRRLALSLTSQTFFHCCVSPPISF